MTSKCGYVAIIGRPNVGKSTLLNQLIGQKLCITSDKPQTTRHQILGVKTEAEVQTIFVDTPGIHQGEKKALNRQMNRAALQSLNTVDVIVLVVDAKKWQEEDEMIYLKAIACEKPLLLVLNKVDKVKDKSQLLPKIQTISNSHKFTEIIPTSAQKGSNVDTLAEVVAKYLPEGQHLFDAEAMTDRSERFLVSELLREQLFRHLGQELPYSTTVGVEQFKEEEKLTRISLVVWVEKQGQKAIIIGKQGEHLKQIVSKARTSIEVLLQRKVFLQVWVKVKSSWTDDERAINSLGYTDGSSTL